MAPPRLSSSTLGALHPGVAIPRYDRAALTHGIVHIGVGNFHRAHQALALDRLMNAGVAHDWAICGVAVLPSDESLAHRMQAQDCLYTLVEKSADGTWSPRVIGSITEVIFNDPKRAIAKMAEPNVRIVSLTVTEGGYNFDRVTGEFMPDTPAIAADLAGTDLPRTFFGIVIEALRRRWKAGIPPFTIMSCDNIQGNGHVAQRMFEAFARAQDPEFAAWLATNVAFPNSMVDRITPVTMPEDIAAVQDLIGVIDECPVVCEPFFQWALEDHFPQGRPPLEDAGAQLVADVAPYEKMKLRLLNGSHQGLAYFAHLMGYRYVHDATRDPDMAVFLRRYMDEEATPTLDPVPGVDLDAYKSQLIERFQNPEVRDTVSRLCAESSDRIPKWLIPVVLDQLRNDGSVELCAAIVASWARYAEGADEQGQPITVVDPLKDELVPIAQRQRVDELAFIANRRLFGDLVDDPRFTEPYAAALNSLHARGAERTLHTLIHSGTVANPEGMEPA
ncbi:MAG: mannitol dehydrogenase family protein [Actinomycetota bacterium]